MIVFKFAGIIRMEDFMTFQDLFKKSFLEGYAANAIGTRAILTALLFSAVMGLFIYFFYRYITRNAYYSKSFNMSLVALCIITTSIILTIQSSIVISLGMVGALSIVRFRTAVKNPIDLVFLFWAISVGIICGAGFSMIAILSSAMLVIALLVLDTVPLSISPLILVMSYAQSSEIDNSIKDTVKKYASYYNEKARVHTCDVTEITVEIRLLKEAAEKRSELTQELSKLSGVKRVSLLSHNGETVF